MALTNINGPADSRFGIKSTLKQFSDAPPSSRDQKGNRSEMQFSSSSRVAVILVGTGPSTKKFLDLAKDRQLVTIGVDRESLDSIADIPVPISTYDSEAAAHSCIEVSVAENLTIVGVLSRSSGPATITVARLAQQFGVPGFSESLARLCVSKKELALFARRMSISSPQLIQNDKDLRRALGELKRVVVKPEIPIVGKKGISIVSEIDDVTAAVQTAAANSFNAGVVYQEWVPGKDISLVTFSFRGEIMRAEFFEEHVGFDERELSSQGIQWGVEIDEFQVSSMTDIAKIVLSSMPASGTVVFSFRVQEKSVCLYEINVGLVGDGLFDVLWGLVWPDDNPFEREFSAMVGEVPAFGSMPGKPARYQP